MKICILKPDYRVRGGFEIVTDKVQYELKKRGYDIRQYKIDMINAIEEGKREFEITQASYNLNPEYFNMVISLLKYNSLDLSEYDVVISTIPPSYAVKHDKVVSIFYHHYRKFYDMADLQLERVQDKSTREFMIESTEIVRKIEKTIFERDIVFLPGSKNIANRLELFNGIKVEESDIFYAGVDDRYFNYKGDVEYQQPICVGRHEFPKRVELFIAAIHLIYEEARVIGKGGLTEFYKSFSGILEYDKKVIQKIDNKRLWMNFNEVLESLNHANIHNGKKITFTSEVSDDVLFEEYKNALCVVCPAYDEDYGLTPIEAMCLRKPVIVCSDGGGLVESVIDGVTGFIVEPKAEKIAEKIKFFIDNPDKAKEMGEAGYQLSRKYDWENAINLVEKKLKEGRE